MSLTAASLSSPDRVEDVESGNDASASVGGGQNGSDVAAGVLLAAVMESGSNKEAELSEWMQLSSILTWTKTLGAKTVALQFPDVLLPAVADVVEWLRANGGGTVEWHVLADTSYGACCLDEVAAEHVSADALVHFGHSCLSLPSRIPTKWVFAGVRGDLNEVKAKFVDALVESRGSEGGDVVVVVDVSYMDVFRPLLGSTEAIGEGDSALKVTWVGLNQDRVGWSDDVGWVALGGGSGSGQSKVKSDESAAVFGRVFPAFGEGETSSVHFVWIGPNGTALTSMMLRWSQVASWSSWSAADGWALQGMATNRLLSRRYFLVEKAKDVETFGLLVGTLGVSQYMEALGKVKDTLRAAQKRLYTFLVGKINPAKLANFSEVELFVLIACPEATLLDSREFYQPVITPWELELALAPGRTWTGEYRTDFEEVLASRDQAPGTHVSAEESGEAPTRVSLVDGSLKLNPKYQASVTDGVEEGGVIDDGSGILTTVGGSRALISAKGSAAAYHAEREYKGLDPRIGETAVGPLVEGRGGIAKGYSGEGGGKAVHQGGASDGGEDQDQDQDVE